MEVDAEAATEDSMRHEEEEEDHAEVLDGREYIEGIQRIERAIIQLLDIAGDGMRLISNFDSEKSQEQIAEFEGISNAYMNLLDKIQYALRTSIHTLIRAGLLRSAASGGGTVIIPYRNTSFVDDQRLVLLERMTRILGKSSDLIAVPQLPPLKNSSTTTNMDIST